MMPALHYAAYWLRLVGAIQRDSEHALSSVSAKRPTLVTEVSGDVRTSFLDAHSMGGKES